ncbi:unnamed protein product [Meloidogyne enterolobii]|uniref:Uncharacterized protein n=1 Tax=Meloidogyne enterolobii TaxID=390850 RepID=A0ACB1A7W7_MELEN
MEKLHDILFTNSGLIQWRNDSLENLSNEYAKDFQEYEYILNTGETLRGWINTKDFDETKQIIVKWRKEEFVKEHCGDTYNLMNNAEPEQKKILIKNCVDQFPRAYRTWNRETNKKIENFKYMNLNDMDHKYNSWRRKLSPFSLLLNSAYLKFAENLIGKLMATVIPQYSLTL